MRAFHLVYVKFIRAQSSGISAAIARHVACNMNSHFNWSGCHWTRSVGIVGTEFASDESSFTWAMQPVYCSRNLIFRLLHCNCATLTNSFCYLQFGGIFLPLRSRQLALFCCEIILSVYALPWRDAPGLYNRNLMTSATTSSCHSLHLLIAMSTGNSDQLSLRICRSKAIRHRTQWKLLRLTRRRKARNIKFNDFHSIASVI